VNHALSGALAGGPSQREEAMSETRILLVEDDSDVRNIGGTIYAL
jgi:hypothetical protein